MSSVKTAISLETNLFNQVNQLSKDLHVSRSKLFALAVKDYLKKQENKMLLAQLNAAYSDSPNGEEKTISKAMHEKHRKIVGRESW
ncbi:MAG: ribbon-helix-helix domain-containing protein [Deltaproteobacteria bacterium]|jgi:metal-responsive CopG/Arc/MetJ family transcriptional regulator|nr:ribbon-helix-helix domain-containing protein [Deltaproteobacteria bacterium]